MICLMSIVLVLNFVNGVNLCALHFRAPKAATEEQEQEERVVIVVIVIIAARI